MSEPVTVSFARLGAPARGVVIVLTDESLTFGAATQKLLKPVDATLTRAFDGERFKGKAFSAVELIAPPRLDATRLVVISVGKAAELKDTDFLRLGGVAAGRIPAGTREATIVLDLPGKAVADAAAAVEVALGVRLRSYTFDRYKTKKTDDTERAPLALTVQVADEAGARAAWPAKEGLAEAVVFARDLVNEPANVLDPPEFARRVEAMLAPAGIAIEVMDDAALVDAGLTALLGVGQGSVKESRVVVMQWKGGGAAEPVAFIGKGVTFDTGGISIKPAAGMEDMKGDMGGAAAVTGLMYALAKRKAKVNAVGIIGLVENMPDGAAQRPGDIVTSLSGQTIEIINTDAEGRLVLADVLSYAKARFKPRFLIDLATLTGAILVALGQEHAGLFSNNDDLAGQILKAGTETGERVWRLPLGPEYDKMIDSKFADMKNSGGRFAGSITAAQFLQRFVGETAWAHLDVAGTAMASPANDISKSWGSGWGIRLLDRLVKDNYEG